MTVASIGLGAFLRPVSARLEEIIGSGLLHAYGFTPGAYRNELPVNRQGGIGQSSYEVGGKHRKFQNIRDNNFDHPLCIALYRKSAYAWLVPKGEIWANGKVRKDRLGVKAQHKRADASIHVDPKNVQPWLQPDGGTIDDMIKVAKHEL